MTDTLDIGHDHTLRFFQWAPDRDLNPQYDGIPDIERAGAIVDHRKPDGSPCSGAVSFDLPALRARDARTKGDNGPYWQVEQWEPLTLSPSLLCHCGDHGFVREGKWVPA